MNLNRLGKGRITVNLALLLASTILCAAAVEGSFRVRGYFKESDLYGKKQKLEEKLRQEGFLSYVGAGIKIRPSRYENIFFELKPDQEWVYLGAKVHTNSEGFRDSEHAVEKGPDTIRIFGVGDSIMFGQGVPQGSDYLSVLEAELNRRYPERHWEAINSGVPDYNTFVEVETLRHKGLKYRPDVVVLGICSNDFDLPAYIFYLGLPDERNVSRYFSFRHSFFLHYLRYRSGKATIDIPGIKNTYLEMSGGGGVYLAMKELRRLASIERFEVLVVNLAPRINKNTEDLMRVSMAFGFHVVNVSPEIQRYMERNGISDYYKSALTVEDGHPSSISHGIAADSLMGFMEKSGMISSLIGRGEALRKGP